MDFPLAIAVIGFSIGYWCSLRLNDRNAPLIIGVCGAIVCYLAAWMLLTIFMVVAPIVIVFWLYPRVWPTVHETLVAFGEQSGALLLRWRQGRQTVDVVRNLRRRMASIDAEIKQVEQSSLNSHAKGSLVDRLREDRDFLKDTLEGIHRGGE